MAKNATRVGSYNRTSLQSSGCIQVKIMASCVSVGSLHTKCRAHCRTKKTSGHVESEQSEPEHLPKPVCIQAGGSALYDRGRNDQPSPLRIGRV